MANIFTWMSVNTSEQCNKVLEKGRFTENGGGGEKCFQTRKNKEKTAWGIFCFARVINDEISSSHTGRT